MIPLVLIIKHYDPVTRLYIGLYLIQRGTQSQSRYGRGEVLRIDSAMLFLLGEMSNR